jgi:hypothetical protein
MRGRIRNYFRWKIRMDVSDIQVKTDYFAECYMDAPAAGLMAKLSL